jgi:hypothetical protein
MDELVDLNYLTRFSSLRTLWLGSKLVQAISYLGLGDYDKLSQVCPLLDELAIDMCPVSIEELQSARSIFALEHELYTLQTEFSSILVSLGHSRLLPMLMMM